MIDENGKNQGVVNRDQALYLAYQKDYDLVEVGPSSSPPICKLLDWSKYKYQLEKKEKKQRAKAKTSELKEIRLSVKISPHDLETKVKKIKEILAEGDRVRLFLILRGREMMLQEQARIMLKQAALSAGAQLDNEITRMGKRFSVDIRR